MGVIRTFIAIKSPVLVRDRLGRLVNTMRSRWPERSVRWVAPENVHLTLRFLGNTAETQIAALSQGLETIAAGYQAFTLTLGKSGTFPGGRRAKVIWTGLTDERGSLGELQQKVEALVQQLGWEPEERVFRPHLTLGRVRQGIRAPTEIWLEHPPPVEFEVQEIELVSSHLKPGGAEYRTLCRAALSRSAA